MGQVTNLVVIYEELFIRKLFCEIEFNTDRQNITFDLKRFSFHIHHIKLLNCNAICLCHGGYL